MSQLLNKIFRYIPEWMFVILIICAGVGLFFWDNPMTTLCDAQIQGFVNDQNGKLFPRAVRVLNPLTGSIYSDNILKRTRAQCIGSVKGMGCYTYFKIVDDVLVDLRKLDNECLQEISKFPVITHLFNQYLTTMTRLAWGERPPRSKSEQKNWLTDREIKTFCEVKTFYTNNYNDLAWNQLVSSALSNLVEDPNKVRHEEVKTARNKLDKKLDIVDEYEFKKAPMDTKRAFDLSLLSLNCIYYM